MVVFVVVPLLPEIVIVRVPVEARDDRLMLSVEVPEPVTDDGLKLSVAPEPWPLAESATAELNPFRPATVTVTVPFGLVLRESVSVVGEALSE